ncbi:hypothetical protein R5R35_005942 [Gryllus longicercus]|uniref:Accessory gland protein n=1 Tax=Gryllus longicercus TaxID=2509291 RepID=A0AAN9V913_9ORTH
MTRAFILLSLLGLILTVFVQPGHSQRPPFGTTTTTTAPTLSTANATGESTTTTVAPTKTDDTSSTTTDDSTSTTRDLTGIIRPNSLCVICCDSGC